MLLNNNKTYIFKNIPMILSLLSFLIHYNIRLIIMCSDTFFNNNPAKARADKTSNYHILLLFGRYGGLVLFLLTLVLLWLFTLDRGSRNTFIGIENNTKPFLKDHGKIYLIKVKVLSHTSGWQSVN